MIFSGHVLGGRPLNHVLRENTTVIESKVVFLNGGDNTLSSK